jgi:hypothetical protein
MPADLSSGTGDSTKSPLTRRSVKWKSSEYESKEMHRPNEREKNKEGKSEEEISATQSSIRDHLLLFGALFFGFGGCFTSFSFVCCLGEPFNR